MTRAELIQSRTENLKELKRLTERLDYLNRKYEITEDDDRYGGAIESTQDQIADIKADLEYIKEELELDNKFKKEGLIV